MPLTKLEAAARLKEIEASLAMFYHAIGYRVAHNQFMINKVLDLCWEREQITKKDWKAARSAARRKK